MTYRSLIGKRVPIVIIYLMLHLGGFSQNNNPVDNYNYFVTFLNEHYGLFPYKSIKWDSLTLYYSKFITDKTSADSLFFTICNLASKLKDKHLWIESDKFVYNYSIGNVFEPKQVDSIFSSRRKYKNPELIQTRYLGNHFKSSRINNSLFGIINEDIGYISFDSFNNNIQEVDSLVTDIVIYLSNCNYLIIDLRNNIGGTDSSALTTANHFLKTSNCYQISKIRDGYHFDSYKDPIYWKTNPHEVSFQNPIIVLINKFTISAAETFSLALKDQPNIKFIGEPSAGAFSDAADSYLPNGWHFTYSIGVWTDCNGFLWEEKGIQPDLFVHTENNEINKDIDPYLELAIKELKK